MAALRTTRLLVVLLTVICGVRSVQADAPLVSIELSGALAVSAPQSELFGPGGALAISARYPLAPQVLLGLELRAGMLTDGDAPSQFGLEDPDEGTFELALLALRLRPLASSATVRRGTGLFFDLSAGGGVTGPRTRVAFQAGLGFGFALGESSALAPTVRYLQIIQPVEALAPEDARVLMLGIELGLFDARPPPPPPLAAKAEPPPDRDGDGLLDASDACPDQPEDLDGHDDADGCPDLDDDADGIPDIHDACPRAAEDKDGFVDEDGCPESDNDEDGIPDSIDGCPNHSEVVNGNMDNDGCPDEGLIVFENDRIVLEEQVLFELERARVKHAGWPVLQAIVELERQHPEWLELRVEGHADATGNPEFNQSLSERRARNTMTKLIDFGFPAEEIRFAGFGSSRPRPPMPGTDENQRNRRVEFVVLASNPAAPQRPLSPSGSTGAPSGVVPLPAPLSMPLTDVPGAPGGPLDAPPAAQGKSRLVPHGQAGAPARVPVEGATR